jgi:citronellol/citronellal dehydrogenase
MLSFAGKTLFISGGSRGIGKAIALRLARAGANIVITGKSETPHPKLPGTIHSAAADIEAAGGRALAVPCDIRFPEQVEAAVAAAVKRFGGIDMLLNNASAVNLTQTLDTPLKRFDLMMAVNQRGTFLCSQACLPHLLKAENPHILTLSPPLDMRAKWFAQKLPYTLSKYGMSLVMHGIAEEFRDRGVAANALWPRTVIATDALKMIPDVNPESCRTPEIVADAAYLILSRPSRQCTGNFFIDEEVLAEAGVTNLDRYAVVPGTVNFAPDFFIDEVPRPAVSQAFLANGR